MHFKIEELLEFYLGAAALAGLVKWRFWPNERLDLLTLMKGDERVELGEESADSCLLLDFSRQSQFGFEEVARRNVKQPMIPCPFGGNHPNSSVPATSLVISHKKIWITLVEPKANVKSR